MESPRKEHGKFFPWAISWSDRWTRGEDEGLIPLSRTSADASRLPNFDSKMGIDATRKWPDEILMDTEVKKKVDALWPSLGLKPWEKERVPTGRARRLPDKRRPARSKTHA
jgi:hypothetical protein